MTRRILNLFFGRQLQRRTAEYLNELRSAPARASRRNIVTLLNSFAAADEPAVILGTTVWGQPVPVPLSEILSGHALMTGSSGAGKTRAAALILQALINQLPQKQFGFGVLDPK